VVGDPLNGKDVKRIDTKTADFFAAAFSPDAKLLATGHPRGVVKVWDWERGEERMSFTGPLSSGKTLSFSADGKALAACGIRGTVSIWDIETGGRRASWKLPNDLEAYAVRFAPVGGVLAIASVNGRVYLWDLQTLSQRGMVQHRGQHLVGLAFSPDGKILATAAANTVTLWEVPPAPK
jgi:WD40 repeat protein